MGTYNILYVHMDIYIYDIYIYVYMYYEMIHVEMSHWTIQPKFASKHHTNDAGVFRKYSDPTPNLPGLLLDTLS